MKPNWARNTTLYAPPGFVTGLSIMFRMIVAENEPGYSSIRLWEAADVASHREAATQGRFRQENPKTVRLARSDEVEGDE